MAFLSKSSDKNLVTGIAFSPDGTKGLVFGAEVKLATTNPVWFIVSMASGFMDVSGSGNL